MSNTSKANLKFAAINPYVEDYIVRPTESVVRGKDFVEWGTKNKFPDYLLDLFNNVSTLRSIINGNVDYTTGDDVTIQPFRDDFKPGQMTLRGDGIRDQIADIAMDYWMMGGFALQIIRDFAGRVSEVYHLPLRFVRTNKEGDVFWYSEKWGSTGYKDAVVYPAFLPNLKWESLTPEERQRNASSVVYVKNDNTQSYPSPVYLAAIKACEIERQIDTFHLSDLRNHFVSSAILNFNNGIPTQEIQEEVSKDIEERFCGSENGGRIMISWNPDKESATDIVTFDVKDFGERYKALASHSRQQIFSAFRAIPLLFGLTSESNTGFSTDEFEQSFKLYNRTMIRPAQRVICDAYDRIFGQTGVLTIKPFSLDGSEANVK